MYLSATGRYEREQVGTREEKEKSLLFVFLNLIALGLKPLALSLLNTANKHIDFTNSDINSDCAGHFTSPDRESVLINTERKSSKGMLPE